MAQEMGATQQWCCVTLRISVYVDQEPAVIVEPVPSGSTLPSAPMDISEDRADAFSRAMVPVEDIDANDHDNPQLVSEYVNDIYDYMRQMEVCVTWLILQVNA